MATIKDIAKITGVSSSTVSRVLNYDNTLSVSVGKRKLILEVAEKLDYQVPKKRVKRDEKQELRLALVHWYSIDQELDDPYYMSIRLGAEKMCYRHNISIVKIFKPDEYSYKKLGSIDGLIAIGKYSAKQIQMMQNYSDNIVFVDYAPSSIKYDSVIVDFSVAVDQALTYLITNGHEKIGYIGGRERIEPEGIDLVEPREQEFVRFMQQRGLYDESLVYVGDFLAESGYIQMRKALQAKVIPTAFFIANDTMAIGALRAVHESGLSVPEDISVVGFNDIPTTKYTVPPLTTVRVYKEKMGEMAVELLLKKIKTINHVAKRVVFSTQLEVRDTVKNIKWSTK